MPWSETMKSSIATKVFGLAVVLVTITIVLVTFLLVQVHSLNRTIHDFSDRFQPLEETLVGLNEAGLRRRLAFERLIGALTGGPGREAALADATAKYEKFTKEISAHVDEAKRLLDLNQADGEFARSFERIRVQLDHIVAIYAMINTRQEEVLMLLRKGDAASSGLLLGMLSEMQVTLQDLRHEVQENIRAVLKTATTHAERQQNKALWLSIAATVVSVSLGLSLAALVTRRLVGPVRSLVTGIGQVKGGDLTVQLIVQSTDEVGEMTRAFNYFVSELRSKEELRNTFGKYVDPRILARIMRDPGLKDGAPDRQEMTISFSDLVGFTNIGEHLTPGNLVNLINRHFTLQAGAIQAHNGVIDKFIGDAVMAFWGPPFTEDADSALLACRAALDEIRAVEKLAVELPDLTGLRRDPPRVNICIGISTGPVVLGNIGSENTRSYTVMGDTVNVASRLEHLNRIYGTRILLCETTRDRAGDGIIVREIDAVVARGKTEQTRIFELLGLADAAPTLRDLSDHFAKGLQAFRRRDWAQAEATFRHCLALRPGDASSHIFLQRIATFRENPPSADWDGSALMQIK
jgi:adenylate cyclase